MSMMQTYFNIIHREPGIKAVIHNKEFVLMEQCDNTYHTDQLAKIPAGTTIIADFAGDFGVYATAEVRGVMHRVKIDLHELHKINWGEFEARHLE